MTPYAVPKGGRPADEGEQQLGPCRSFLAVLETPGFDLASSERLANSKARWEYAHCTERVPKKQGNAGPARDGKQRKEGELEAFAATKHESGRRRRMSRCQSYRKAIGPASVAP